MSLFAQLHMISLWNQSLKQGEKEKEEGLNVLQKTPMKIGGSKHADTSDSSSCSSA